MKTNRPGWPATGSTNVDCEPKVTSQPSPVHGEPFTIHSPMIDPATAYSAGFGLQPVQPEVMM